VNPNRRNNYLAASIALALGGTTLAMAHDPSTRTVGPQSDGSYIVSDNQRISPAGKLVKLGPWVRAKAVAVNPNFQTKTGAVMLMGASQPIIVFNTVTGEVIQSYSPPTDSMGSFTGIAYSSDGSKLLFSEDDNFVAVAKVDATGKLTPAAAIKIPAPDNPNLYTPGLANPGGIAIADGSIGLVAINASNALGILDLNNGTLKSQVPVGNAPNHVVVRGNLAYVSNEGGRPATSADFSSTR
jgi:hypothetical protein